MSEFKTLEDYLKVHPKRLRDCATNVTLIAGLKKLSVAFEPEPGYRYLLEGQEALAFLDEIGFTDFLLPTV